MPRCPTCHRRLAAGARCPGDGARAAAGIDLPPPGDPPPIDGFRVGELLGRGGFASVWGAVRDRDGLPVAIKAARVASPFVRDRFRREASALSLVGPPHVPALHLEGSSADGSPHLVMERFFGVTLATYLEQQGGPPGFARVRALADAILANLEAIHARGVSHHDLKPSNIFVTSAAPAETRLLDFGLTAAIGRSSDSSIQVVAGSSEYLAPERLEGQPSCGVAADLYAFGVILYELLTLRVPFVGDRGAIEGGHRALRPPRPGDFAAVPPDVEAICLSCLAKDPASRPPDAATLRRRLATAAQDPAPARGEREPRAAQVSTRLIAGKQPVVLLVTEGVSDLASLLKRRGGAVVRQLGKRQTCAFTGLQSDEPARNALEVAEQLSGEGGRVALHLAGLRVRGDADGAVPRVYGADVERPERWLPPEPWRGLLVSADLAPAIEVPVAPAPEAPGFFVPAPATPAAVDVEPPLIGRDPILAEAEESLRACVADRAPGLFTVIGGPGLGKSRLASALALAASRRFGGAAVVTFIANPGSGAGDLLAPLGAALDPDETGPGSVRAIGDRLLRAARANPIALIIDDAHHLDDEACDAIEYATLDAENRPLWIAVLANPRLLVRRRGWGARSFRHHHLELEPLPEAAAMALAADQLRPAEYPPAATLRRLARWSGGNPFTLVELARTLKREGVVRQRAATGSFYVATAELEKLPALPAGQWLASRRLEEMPAEVAALARLCSVLGAGFSTGEVAAVQDAADRAGAPTSAIDTRVGLSELERRGAIARAGDEQWSFRDEATADAIYKLLDPADARRLHLCAMELWRARAEPGDDDALSRFARHAAAGGHSADAARAFLELGNRARAAHHSVDADQHYTAALAHVGDDVAVEARALGGRGKVRYRMQRIEEAIADLASACELAAALGDRPRRVRWLLEQATALDWADRYLDSARLVAEACELSDQLDDPVLAARCVVALGRTRWREEKIGEAIELLDRGAALAAEADDYETRVIALLLLPLALVFSGRRDEAAERFVEVIELCEARGDNFHLCAAYGNRMFLWRNLPDLAVEDLRRANQLAREVGQAGAERVTTHNLAEILYWSGDDRESLALARRALALQRRLMAEPVADDSLLLARIHAARQEWRQVDELLGWIRTHVAPESLAPSDLLLIRTLELSRQAAENPGPGGEPSWETLIDEAREVLAAEEFLEVLYMRGRAAADRAAWSELESVLDQSTDRLGSCAVWRGRFDSLTARAADRI
jgi:tetratricopeptide (TPR) repeat protein